MVTARGLRGLHRIPRRGIFFGLHHGLAGGLQTVLVVVLIIAVAVLLLRGRR